MLSKKVQKATNNYLKYSGMAFQMIAVIVLFAFAGVFLDKKVSWRIPLFTILLTILGVVAALYSSLKDFIKKDTKKDEDV